MQAIANLCVPSPDVLFVDAHGVLKSYEAISNVVKKTPSMGGGSDEFVALDDFLGDGRD